ncbi:MAG: alpha/beta fold hydrolase [Proteobacteria bacterium]|nr:alpha/beta fold hydrolase [Pseudomonadota bacterium]
MARAKANGIEIEYETAGDPKNPALLLVMGLGGQLTIWPDAFFQGLAAKGFYVIRYDNRDTGLSTDFDAAGLPNMADAMGKLMAGQPIDAPYKLDDLAADAIGLLDALGIERAHMVGMSMGGMIVQILAAKYAARCRSMVSIMSTSGRRGLPTGNPQTLALLMAQPANLERETLVAQGLKVRQALSGGGYAEPEADLRAFVERNVDRRFYPPGAARHYLAVIASGDRVELLKTIKVPTLVLHGEGDPLVPVEAGRDVAALVPGARIETFPGWGHNLPGPFLPTLIDRLAGFCKDK